MDSRPGDDAGGGERPGLGTHTDERGVIRDLLGRIDGVTEITTAKGAVRGNHVHERTAQWTYVVSGRMRVAAQPPGGTLCIAEYGPGELFKDEPGIAHAWQAIADCRVLVFTRGPRSGEDYETDTRRLEAPLLP